MKRHGLKAAAASAALLLASLACGSLPSLTGAGEPPLLKDDFASSDSGWGTGTDSESSVEYDSGALDMQLFKDNFFTWSTPDGETYENVHLEVTAQNRGGNAATGFGLLCGKQTVGSAYYYFAVTSGGEYVIGKSSLVLDDVFLTNDDSWAASDLIARNAASYRIGADCGPGTLTLYVDGKKIDSASDTSYSSGGVGLFVWSGDDPEGEVLYDDFVMTRLK